jgi:hypothetical protein
MRRLAALAVVLTLAASKAHAQLSLGAGVQYFRWSEHTSPAVTESGPLLAIALGLAQSPAAPLRVAYRGRGGIGIADYRGSFLFSPQVPATATTVFATMGHEAQLRARAPANLEAVGALTFDWWHRQLSARQQEDYQTLSLRISVERAERGSRGWSGGGGLQLPLAVREDAHFTDLGYQENPSLEPGRRAGWFASLGYRFASHVSCVGTFDTFHLDRSKPVSLKSRGGAVATAFQPATDLLFMGIGIQYTR